MPKKIHAFERENIKNELNAFHLICLKHFKNSKLRFNVHLVMFDFIVNMV